MDDDAGSRGDDPPDEGPDDAGDAPAWRPRVLPPIWALLVAGAMWGVAAMTDPALLPDEVRRAWPLALVAGVGLILWAALHFWRHETPLEPGHEPAALVTDGPYRLSRNPIYLGMALTLLAWAIALGNPLTLLGPPVFLAIAYHRFIRHEERLLADRFDESWHEFRSRTRRWL